MKVTVEIPNKEWIDPDKLLPDIGQLCIVVPCANHEHLMFAEYTDDGFLDLNEKWFFESNDADDDYIESWLPVRFTEAWMPFKPYEKSYLEAGETDG